MTDPLVLLDGDMLTPDQEYDEPSRQKKHEIEGHLKHLHRLQKEDSHFHFKAYLTEAGAPELAEYPDPEVAMESENEESECDDEDEDEGKQLPDRELSSQVAGPEHEKAELDNFNHLGDPPFRSSGSAASRISYLRKLSDLEPYISAVQKYQELAVSRI